MTLESAMISFALGLLATTSPCVLPLYPGYLAYLTRYQDSLDGRLKPYALGFAVLAGVLSMMLAMGAIIAALSIPIGRALSIFVPLSNMVILVFGLLLLLNINPFKRLPQIQAPLHKHPIASAFTYGLLYGPIALPCSGPLVVGIFALSATAGDVASQLLSFLWFGLGFGLPLLLLSFISASSQRGITRFFAMNARLVNIMAGLLLVTIAVVDLYRNWDLIGAYL